MFEVHIQDVYLVHPKDLENVNISSIFFADDLALIGKNSEALKTLVNITRNYFAINRLTISEKKTKIMNVVREFRHTQTEHGWPKNNLEKKEIEGIKEIKDKIKKKELVVFKTDKSSKLCVDDVENYKEAVKVHTKDDEIVDWKTVQKIENNMNDHLKAFNKMMNVGTKPDQHGNTLKKTE